MQNAELRSAFRIRLAARRGGFLQRGRALLVAMRGFDKAREQGMRPQRPRLELRVKLDRDVPGMRRQFRDLDELAVWRSSRHAHAALGQRRLVEAVELEAMAMPLPHLRGAVHLRG